MRKVTSEIIKAFLNHEKRSIGNSVTNGTTLYLHSNPIAKHTANGIEITNCGWETNTTKERLNGIPGVHITQKNFIWFLNGVEWDGKPTLIPSKNS